MDSTRVQYYNVYIPAGDAQKRKISCQTPGWNGENDRKRNFMCYRRSIMAELSIAIADDNRQTLNLLGEILEKEDGIHVVGKADNGEDAYNMIVRTNPDIVLMDVIMPRLDGISVMEKVKNNTQMKNHPSFIMVTAASSQDVTEDAFRLGANYYINLLC